MIILYIDCRQATDAQVRLSCANDTLTVIWPSDVVYNGTISLIPADLEERLTERWVSESQYQILSLMVMTQTPP